MKTEKNPQDYISPLFVNGLNGRIMRLPAPKKHQREILFIYGHHSTLERWWGLAQGLNDYGAITMPDLPGFGGMDSFYRIGKEPTLDNLADYLAAFVKMHYKRKRFTIAGLSFGFVVATRMLQRYPDIAKKVDLCVSIVGFAHHEDFTFSKKRMFAYRAASSLLQHRVPALIFRHTALNPFVLRAVYAKTPNAKHKFANMTVQERRRMMNFEVLLWHANDVKTHWMTSVIMLTLNNCNVRVDMPVWHVAVKGEKYFDNDRVEQHFRVIFTDFTKAVSVLDNHAPSIIATKKDAAPLIPAAIRSLLSTK